MTKDRSAIPDMTWASSLEALQTAYCDLQAKPLTADERESATIIFNDS